LPKVQCLVDMAFTNCGYHSEDFYCDSCSPPSEREADEASDKKWLANNQLRLSEDEVQEAIRVLAEGTPDEIHDHAVEELGCESTNSDEDAMRAIAKRVHDSLSYRQKCKQCGTPLSKTGRCPNGGLYGDHGSAMP